MPEKPKDNPTARQRYFEYLAEQTGYKVAEDFGVWWGRLTKGRWRFWTGESYIRRAFTSDEAVEIITGAANRAHKAGNCTIIGAIRAILREGDHHGEEQHVTPRPDVLPDVSKGNGQRNSVRPRMLDSNRTHT